MRQLSAIASVGILVLPLAGCNSNTEETSATTPAPQVVVTTPTAKPFTKPALVAQKPIVVTSPGLIQPTNANQRAKQVQTGRQDPFAGLFLRARPSVATSGAPTVSQPGNPTVVATAPSSAGTSTQNAANTASADAGNRATNNRDNQVAARTGTQPRSINPTPSSSEDTSIPVTPDDNFPVSPDEGGFPPPLPSTPEPELARQIAVSGVIQIGEQLQAIVQVPNEGTSRYVRVGQRLSNGEILVKRIEMTSGVEPIVILEQFGVEVAKAIGEQPTEANGSEPAPSDEASPAPSPSPQPTPSPATSPAPTPLPTNIQPTLPPGINPVPVPPPLPNSAPNEGG